MLLRPFPLVRFRPPPTGFIWNLRNRERRRFSTRQLVLPFIYDCYLQHRIRFYVVRTMAHVVMGRLFPAHIVRSRYIAPQSLPTGCREMLDPDRISGSCFLARTTERQSGRALSQRCEKVLRFPTICPLPRFRVSLPAGSPERFAGTV